MRLQLDTSFKMPSSVQESVVKRLMTTSAAFWCPAPTMHFRTRRHRACGSIRTVQAWPCSWCCRTSRSIRRSLRSSDYKSEHAISDQFAWTQEGLKETSDLCLLQRCQK